MTRTFVRFVGRLWETNEFELGVGWETQRIARRPRAAPDYQLELVSNTSEVLVQAGVELRENICMRVGTAGTTAARVVGYMPLRPDGATIVFRRGERLLHSVELAPAPPRVAITGLEIDADETVHLRWEAEHDRPLWFNVVFVDEKHRAIPVHQELTEQSLTLQTRELPGGDGCALAVIATDGLRSATARSDQFALSQKPARLAILQPAADEILPPDQPVSLLGVAYDLAGRALPDEGLVWLINDQIVARGLRLTCVQPLEPGEYHIQLAYRHKGEAETQTEVQVSVPQRTVEQEQWLRLSTKRVE